MDGDRGPETPAFGLHRKGVLLVGSVGPLLDSVYGALRTAGASVAVVPGPLARSVASPSAPRSRIDQLVGEATREIGHIELLVIVLGPADLGPSRMEGAPTSGSLRDRILLLDTAAAAEFTEQGRAGRIVHVVPAVPPDAAPSAGEHAEVHAVLGLTQGLAVDLGRHDITVNAVAYGPLEGTVGPDARRAPADRLERIPKGRLGRVEDVSSTVVFLCSDEADYLTGAVLHLDGGHRLT